MDSEGMFCPVEECKHNRGGFCGTKQPMPIGYTPAAFFPPNYTNFFAPMGPAMGILNNDVRAEGQPPITDDWGMWRNCPRAKQRE